MNKYILRKIEKFWVIFIVYADGSVNDYRFKTKAEAKKWDREVKIDLVEE